MPNFMNSSHDSLLSDQPFLTEDGFLLVYRNWLASKHPLYNARVSLPKLKVECWATEIEKASDADLAAAICLTLRTAPDKSHN